MPRGLAWSASRPGIFDAPSNPVSIETILEAEKLEVFPEAGDLETMFQDPLPANTVAQSSTVNATPEEVQVPQEAKPPDIILERSPVPLRRSPRFSGEANFGLNSIQTVLPREGVENLSPEIDLGEETISFNATNVQLDISKMYKRSLGRDPLDTLGVPTLCTPEEEMKILNFRSVLRKKKKLSFWIPPDLYFPEKDLDLEF